MANLVLGGMTSLSQTMEIPNASNQKLLDAWHVVEPLKIANPCKVAIIKTTEQTEETHDIQDLPMSHFDFHSPRDRNLKAKHIVDCILDYRCAFNEKQILTLGEKSKFDEMPEPLCLKMPANDIGYYLQIVAREKSPGVWDILKHYYFEEPQKLSVWEDRMKQGQTCLLSWWKANTFGTKKIFQYIFERLGGFQITWCE
jgi:hypothetical protein